MALSVPDSSWLAKGFRIDALLDRLPPTLTRTSNSLSEVNLPGNAYFAASCEGAGSRRFHGNDAKQFGAAAYTEREFDQILPFPLDHELSHVDVE